MKINSFVLKKCSILLTRDHLAHAYLLVGPSHAGKFETAKEIAKLVNCEPVAKRLETPCGECPSCCKIDSGNHPDLNILEGSLEESIKIEQVRELLGRVMLRPFMAKKKVFILKNVENLTQEAANALLKTLEEPTTENLFLLTTAKLKNVLDTIKSRCHLIHFYPMSQRRLAKQLAQNYNLDDSKAQCLAYFAQGYIGKAMNFLDNKIFDKRDEVIDCFIFARGNENFFKKIGSQKESIGGFLYILLTWIRDAILMKAGINHFALFHSDRLKDLHRFQMAFSFEELNNLKDEVIKTSQLLTENLNIKIPFLIIKEQIWAKSLKFN